MQTRAVVSLLGFSADISLTTPSIYCINGFKALETRLLRSAKKRIFCTQSLLIKILLNATAVLVLPTPQGNTSKPFLRILPPTFIESIISLIASMSLLRLIIVSSTSLFTIALRVSLVPGFCLFIISSKSSNDAKLPTSRAGYLMLFAPDIALKKKIL